MIPLDIHSTEFQAFIRRELNLGEKPVFSSCDIFRGTPFQERCIGLVQDRGMTNILLRGTYEISGAAIILYLELPGAPDPRVPRQEIDRAGLQPEKTRIVGVCARKEGTPAGGPEIQIILIPY